MGHKNEFYGKTIKNRMCHEQVTAFFPDPVILNLIHFYRQKVQLKDYYHIYYVLRTCMTCYGATLLVLLVLHMQYEIF